MSSLIKDAVRSGSRNLCRSGFYRGFKSKNFKDSPQFKAFKEKQAKMQCDDGYPVHLKGGTFDKILYHATVGGCVLGLVQSFHLIYVLATTK